MRKIKSFYICFTRSRINFLKMNKNVSDELGQETQYTKQQQGTLGNSFSGAVVSGNDNTGVESVSVPVMLKPNLQTEGKECLTEWSIVTNSTPETQGSSKQHSTAQRAKPHKRKL